MFPDYKDASAKCIMPAGKRVSSAMDGKYKAIHGTGFRQSLPE
jgi:hypothetical protein